MSFFFFKQKTAYEMRISDWSSDVCSSDLVADIHAVFKAYDIRGTTPDQLDAELVRSIGVAFARFVRTRPEPHERVLVGRDMRPSGVELVDAFCDGVTSQGMDVTRIGLASTDMMYFAAGSLDAPGAMFTASQIG